jgi:hypothetical protein
LSPGRQRGGRDDPPDRDDLAERLDRLEATLEELRDAVVEDERVDAGRSGARPAAETALRLTERLAVPAAVAALEANVRLLEFLQDRLRAIEAREAGETRATTTDVSERLLGRLDDALARMEDAIAEADLPADAEARRLLERARDLNEEVRERAAGAEPPRQDVVTIDVEEELDQLREDVGDEDDEE